MLPFIKNCVYLFIHRPRISWRIGLIFAIALCMLVFQQAYAVVPVWVVAFDKCTQYEESLQEFMFNLHSKLSDKQRDETLAQQIARIMKAREDVNKLIGTVYNELRTQQVVLNDDIPDFRDTLQSLGIVVKSDDDAVCKASHYIKAEVGGGAEECVAVAQEARIITEGDDYIYEEGRRRAMDALFCYLGEWRHFPIADINDPSNCEALGLDGDCDVQEAWQALGDILEGDPGWFNDLDGTKTPDNLEDDQHDFVFCEGLRALGKKCAQDAFRDYIKYSTIDNRIARKDRTLILAPPQTWYTPARCRVITSFMKGADEVTANPASETPYTKNIKSLDLQDTLKFTSSFELINFYFGSKFGAATLPKSPASMNPAEFDLEKEMGAINIPENSFSGLASKTEELVDSIIKDVTELRKLQYSSGEGLRDATLRIGWNDYEWGDTANPLGDAFDAFLGKYKALDLPIDDPRKPNKIFKPLACYWESDEHDFCDPATKIDIGTPTGETFYFDTGIVISPIAILKDKLQSAIQAQFDLARDAFAIADPENPLLKDRVKEKEEDVKGCKDFTLKWVAPSVDSLPAPWEDEKINLTKSINPLTGEAYQKGPHLIPDLEANYFNALYNDVFQLYHTPIPQVLEHWFRLNPAGDDSIYTVGQGETPFDDDGGDGDGIPDLPPGGTLPVGCAAYKADFKDVGSQTGVDACLLEAIAAAESTCRPGAESSHACGLMQLTPETASSLAGRPVSCAELKANPRLSIELAAKYLQMATGTIAAYASRGFDIGNAYTQSGSSVRYGPNIYDTGNDDLIASYNGGTGGGCGSPKQAFCPSSDCTNPPTPAWQCNIDPGGFKETQTYVQRVQNFQRTCTP